MNRPEKNITLYTGLYGWLHAQHEALQHEVQDKTNKYKLTQKGNKISDQMV